MKTNILNRCLQAVLIAGLDMLACRVTAQDFGTLHQFEAPHPNNYCGVRPESLLLLLNTLYGTDPASGSWSEGTVFALNSEGTGFTNLLSFAPWNINGDTLPNADGAWPRPGAGVKTKCSRDFAEEGLCRLKMDFRIRCAIPLFRKALKSANIALQLATPFKRVLTGLKNSKVFPDSLIP